MKKFARFRYPEFINETAEHIAKLRCEANEKLRAKKKQFDRGDKNMYYEILGVKGEMIFQTYLWANDYYFESALILDANPVKTYDVKIVTEKGETRVDVKANAGDTESVYINKSSHQKGKGVDVYVFVKIFDDNWAELYRADHAEVDNWGLVRFGKNNWAFTFPLALLKE